mgnify:CR=1 FL=1
MLQTTTPHLPSPSRKLATIVLAAGEYLNTAVLIVQGLLLVPLYLHFIGAHLYGLWLSTGGILGILSLVNFGISRMLVQRTARAYGQSDYPKVGGYFINGMLVYFAITFIFITAGILISYGLPFIFSAIGNDDELLVNCFQLAVLAAGLSIINECLRGFAHALLRPLVPTLAAVVIRTFGILMTVFLLYQEFGLWALPLAMLVSEGLIFIVGLLHATIIFIGLKTKAVLDFSIIKEYFQIGGVLFMARLGNVLSRESDPILITYFFRPEITVAYMLTRRAADIVSQMLSIINGATHSSFSHLAGQDNDSKTAVMASKFVSLTFILAMVGFVAYVIMNHSFVSLWVGEAFVLNHNIIFFIGIAFFISSLRNVALQTLNGLGDFKYSSWIIFFEGIGSVLFSALLLSFLGLIGIPISLIATGLLSGILLSLKLQTKIRLNFSQADLKKAFILFFSLFALGAIAPYYSSTSTSWLMFIIHSTVFLIIILITLTLAYKSKFKDIIKLFKHKKFKG